VKGRKRQLVVDTLGLPLCVLVHAANIADKTAGKAVLRRVPWTPRLKEIRADQGYDSPALAHWCDQVLGAALTVTQRDPNQKGFVVQKGRWVVERTFAWLGRYRRLSKDYEQSTLLSEGFVYVASIHILVRRLAR
jgi:putative transposase